MIPNLLQAHCNWSKVDSGITWTILKNIGMKKFGETEQNKFYWF